ncbi:Fic family protein [Dyadobacter sp. Leaf189]|uniref:Fic family protein n=1 Tax=Dyadobacter sp. Leaf189 TaxID=1736295 RepID=UPI0006FF5E36|nr:Fic family protein [Dyadobacter sp. Leaf189]KQS27974.1 cell filamentation protein Fic [Dyadobacter sp. Leaf189]
MKYQINPDRSVPWNDLPDLPLNPELYRTVEIFEQLGSAKAALGKLQGRSIAIPNQGMLVNTISLQEAKASSAIENIFTTDDELYKAFSEDQNERISGPLKEILMYREALWEGFQYLNERKQFDHNYFRDIYRQVNQASDDIRPPFIHTYIRQGGTGPNAGKPIYTPPRGTGIVDAKLENLIRYLNDDVNFAADPLIKMAIAHFQFEAIHPFRDGNGRTGRIMNIHYLTHKGLLDYPILFMSRYIMDHKDDYYNGLMGVSQRGDWHTWILYMLRAIEVTANLTYDKINDVINTKDAILRAIIAETDVKRPESLVNVIFTQPLTRVRYITGQKLYSENTAKKYLNQLVSMGILERRSIQGNHYYLNSELYRILAE